MDINLKKEGLLKTLPNGDKLWLLKIHSDNAFSINLIYNKFYLSEGAIFFVYNESKTMVLGAFTSENSNNPYNEFATDLVQGSTIILELYEPKFAENSFINISKVIHGYIDTFESFSSGFGSSANCNIDVNCPLGNSWINEKNAVSLMLVDDNTAFCTGCLVNNTKQDYTPFYLTADHCIPAGSNTNVWIFRFKYWKPNCSNGMPGNWITLVGATIRARHASTDFALLELNTLPPIEYNLFYAGWERTGIREKNTTAIHHPNGDAMKISYSNNLIDSISWSTGPMNHWRTSFSQGIVQFGSSGSPLFNPKRRIIGQLHGNQNNQCLPTLSDNYCHCEQTPVGEYGRFDISWTGGGTNTTRLSNWLDPINTGATYLNGTYRLPLCSNPVTNYVNQVVNANTTIVGCYINAQNVSVISGKKLVLDAIETTTIIKDLEIPVGAELEIK